MKHVLFINRSYWPDIEATGQLLTELAEDLAQEFRITVICGQPVEVRSAPDFKRFGVQNRHNVRIIRLWHTRFHKARFVGRLINMITFLVSASLRAMLVRRVDVLVVETDPPLLCLLGRGMQLIRRCRLVCYLQDIYPDVAIALGKLQNNWLTRMIDRTFYRIYRNSNAVVVLSRDMQQHLVARGIDAKIIHGIPNWVDTTQIRPTKTNNRFRERHQLDEKFVVMYSGNLGFSQRLEQLIEAAKILQIDNRFQFLLVGNGANRKPLEELTQRLGVANTRFLDYQPKPELSESLSAADLQVVFLDPRITHCLMPSKIYGILAVGTPVLALAARDSELAAMILENQIGAVVLGNDAQLIAEKIVELADDPKFCDLAGERARSLAVDRFDRQISVAAFGKMLNQVINGAMTIPVSKQIA